MPDVSLILQATGKAFEVGGDGLVVGRSDDADLFLNDPGVSRQHCRVFQRARSVAVEDLGSAGGTLLNGERVTKPKGLKDGDEIRVGDVVLRVAMGGGAGAAEAAASDAGDATVVAAPLDTPAPGESLEIDLAPRPVIVFGRDEDCDVTLPYPMVSRRHAEVRAEARGHWVRDLGSTNGTYVNGARTKGQALEPGDVIGIGPHRLTYDGRTLSSEAPEHGTRIEVRGLAKEVLHRDTGKPFFLLQNIDLTIEPKEFVGLLGSSGCGKSTFMDTVNGRRPATAGEVLYNGENLYNRFDAFKQGIGYVPQELIFHEELPLEDVLRYASRLRLPDDTSDQEIETNIDRVLDTVGLADRRKTLVTNLSGGQKKRVSIAIELLARPTLLFLDEATSGLDLGTEAQMMRLFRQLADGGVTTMCITHYVESLEMCDVVAYFVQGRLAYYGPPAGLKSYFGADSIREVYVKESDRQPEEWEADFLKSKTHRQFVADRAAPQSTGEQTIFRKGQAISHAPKRDARRQMRVLTKRYVQLVFGDRRNLLMALGLAPLIALLICLVLSEKPPLWEAKLATYLGTAIVFLGIFSSIREIVKELPVYRHERFVNLEIVPYLASKAIPLAALVAVQALEMLIIVHVVLAPDAALPVQWIVLALNGIGGMLLGLAISAGAETADKAVMVMILAVIPQVLFQNAQLLPDAADVLAMIFVISFWSFEGLIDLTKQRAEFGLAMALPMLLAFCALYAFLAYFFLRRKDGGFGRF